MASAWEIAIEAVRQKLHFTMTGSVGRLKYTRKLKIFLYIQRKSFAEFAIFNTVVAELLMENVIELGTFDLKVSLHL